MFDQLETLKPLREAANMLAESRAQGSLARERLVEMRFNGMRGCMDDMYVNWITAVKRWRTFQTQKRGSLTSMNTMAWVRWQAIVDKLMTMVEALEALPK